jgi:hypothetical protein
VLVNMFLLLLVISTTQTNKVISIPHKNLANNSLARMEGE